jgi:hypothetical protein
MLNQSNLDSILLEIETLIPPDRGEMLTQPIVTELNPQVQQGTAKSRDDATVYSNVDPAKISFYRWW